MLVALMLSMVAALHSYSVDPGMITFAPYIISQPQNITTIVGETVTFTSNASGVPEASRAWQRSTDGGVTWSEVVDTPPFNGVGTNTLTISGVTLAMTGDQYRSLATNDLGSATSNQATLTVTKIPQTIAYVALEDMNYTEGGIEINATASSGLPVEFSVVYGPAHRHAANPTLILDSIGTIVVRLSQPGNASYAAAPDIEFSFTVHPTPITLSFNESTLTKVYNGVGVVPPTVQTTPYIPTTFTITYDGSNSIPVNAGEYTVYATINDPRYTGTTTSTYTITRATQYIYGGGPGAGPWQFTPPEGPVSYPYAEAAGGPVTLTVVSGPGRLDGQKLTATGAGTIVLRGTQGGSLNYLPAPDRFWSLLVTPAAQSLTFAPLTDRPYTTSPVTLNATATSGLAVIFAVMSGPAIVSGSQLTITGTGTVTVRAAQTGNADYLAAEPVERSFSVFASLLSWNEEHFTSGELADAAISGPVSDPDGDGLTNLLEYALNLNPKSVNTTGLPEMGASASAWTYTYTRPADRADLTYEVETSTDLVNWTTTGVAHTMTADHGTTQTWQATTTLDSASNVFFRLKVTQN